MKAKHQEVIDYLEHSITLTWNHRIKYGKKYGLPLGVEIGKTDYEALSCAFFNIRGTGRNSGDHDHNNGDETKGANKIRAKNCKCGNVCHFFEEICECGSDEFTYTDNIDKTDVRWGIDTDAHFRYKVPNYHLWILEAQDYHASNKTFYLKLFSVSGTNRMFNDILMVQKKSKSKTKNFIPYSKDFYASNPKMLGKFKILLSFDGENVQITEEPIEEIYITKDMILNPNHIQKYLPKTFLPSKDTYLYEEIEPYLNVNLYISTHGKERGKTNRRSK